MHSDLGFRGAGNPVEQQNPAGWQHQQSRKQRIAGGAAAIVYGRRACPAGSPKSAPVHYDRIVSAAGVLHPRLDHGIVCSGHDSGICVGRGNRCSTLVVEGFPAGDHVGEIVTAVQSVTAVFPNKLGAGDILIAIRRLWEPAVRTLDSHGSTGGLGTTALERHVGIVLGLWHPGARPVFGIARLSRPQRGSRGEPWIGNQETAVLISRFVASHLPLPMPYALGR